MRVGVYVHVPFCRRKCAYCDFVSYAGREILMAPYVDAVLAEAASYSDRGFEAGTIYIGGGTPTTLGSGLLCRLLSGLSETFQVVNGAETTVEANPGTVSREDLEALRACGVNRLSIGVQSFDDRMLLTLGRIHNSEEAARAVRDAQAAGFRNISLDLMFGLPGQTLEQWQGTLEKALELGPQHLSLYALMVEEGTPLASQIEGRMLAEPDPDLAADMYEWAEDRLDEAGYIHYEISNWAAGPAFVCRHNVAYWERKPYVGLGVAAHSFLDGYRTENTASLEEYVRRPMTRSDREAGAGENIAGKAAMAETMFLGLRMMRGVGFAEFAEEFGVDMRQVYGAEIAELVDAGLLEEDGAGVRLTRPGRLLGNQVFCRFLA